MSSHLSRTLPLFPLPPGCVTLFILFPHGKDRRCPYTEDQYQVTQACKTWQTACFLALILFTFLALLLCRHFESTHVSWLFILFLPLYFVLVFCKVSYPHCVVCCIKFLQRSIRGSFNTKRLGMTDDNAISTSRNWSSPWGKPLNETYQEFSRLQHCPEKAIGDSLVPLATLGESLLILPPPSLPCSSSQVDGTFGNWALVFLIVSLSL